MRPKKKKCKRCLMETRRRNPSWEEGLCPKCYDLTREPEYPITNIPNLSTIRIGEYNPVDEYWNNLVNHELAYHGEKYYA